MKLLCGPEGYCNALVLCGVALARCDECQARDDAVAFWGRLFPAENRDAPSEPCKTCGERRVLRYGHCFTCAKAADPGE